MPPNDTTLIMRYAVFTANDAQNSGSRLATMPSAQDGLLERIHTNLQGAWSGAPSIIFAGETQIFCRFSSRTRRSM